MEKVLLTVYIPTFNRAHRLVASLTDLFREIKNKGLESKVFVLVGDNGSLDETPRVCARVQEEASQCGIQFGYFRNTENLGFSGNIAAGLKRATSEWIMFLSDDDKLCSGAIEQVCADLIEKRPSVALYNFSQPPFDFKNPLITKTDFSFQNSDYSPLTSLISWPKMTGVVLEMAPMIPRMPQINEICDFSSHFAHVTLSLYIFKEAPGLLKSTTFLAEADEDYLEHVNFVPYIDQYLARELEIYRALYDSSNVTLNGLINRVPRTNILESSVDALLGFYRGKVRMTESVKGKLFTNLIRFLSGKRETSDGLSFSRPSARFFLKLLSIPVFVLIRFLLSGIRGRRPLLMKDGF